MAAEFQLSELKETDFAHTARFLASIFGGDPQHMIGCLEHWSSANPAWNETIPRGWLIRSVEGAPIAFTSNIPFRYIIAGTPGICCATGSTSVHFDWRGRGLSKLIGRAFLNQECAALLIGTGSTDIAYRLWLSLGMRPLDRQWPLSSYRLIADPYECTAMLSAKMHLPEVLGRITSIGVAALAHLLVKARYRRPGISVRQVERFETVDAEAILECRASYASTYALRDIRTLNWLYFGTKYLRETRAVFVARSSSKLIGYLAMKKIYHTYYVLECRCLNADPEIARELLLAARDFADRTKALYITIWRYTSMIDQAVPRSVSVPTKQPPMMTYCYVSRNHRVSNSNWEATPGDGDLSVN